MPKALDKEGLSEEDNLREKYAEKYIEISKEHDRLGKVLNQDLEKLLEDGNIDILSVTYRIKDVDKFLEKIKRKKYDSPFNDIKDICGLRIICYYTSDLDKIYSIIENEFDILEIVDKVDLLKDDRFGYLSRHYIIKLKNDWLKTPSYRDLDDLVAEIQVRTILQHAWADISHKLVYKKEEQIPRQFKRKLNSLSCILENSDIQFDSLRDDRSKYIDEISEKAVESGNFDLNQELNLDSFSAFLDFYFPDRIKDIDSISELLDEILAFNKQYNKNISFKAILDAYKKSEEYLAIFDLSRVKEVKRKEIEKLKKEDPFKFKEESEKYKFFSQAGIVRMSLENSYKDYKYYPRLRRKGEFEKVID